MMNRKSYSAAPRNGEFAIGRPRALALRQFPAPARAGLFALFLLGFTAPAAHAATVFPYAYTKEILPNGLTAIVIPMESPGQVAYYSVVRTGSRDEVEEGKSGFAYFF